MPTLWIEFPASVNLIKIIPHKCCLVSQKILGSFKMTVDVKHWKWTLRKKKEVERSEQATSRSKKKNSFSELGIH